MSVEIEHKYLVDKKSLTRIIPESSHQIRQGYLSIEPSKTVRIRTKDKQGFITIKGKTQGSSRLEFEYEIPYTEATELIKLFCSCIIEKTRHIVLYEGKIWEIDEFKGMNEGLVIAEIELSNETEEYRKPEWLDVNVTKDMKYANSNLSVNPYSTW